jgi:hypothetical protein
MTMINATGLDRKSGGAQWRDLRFLFPELTLTSAETDRTAVKGESVSRELASNCCRHNIGLENDLLPVTILPSYNFVEEVQMGPCLCSMRGAHDHSFSVPIP